MEKYMKELNEVELEQVSGGWLLQLMGGLSGGLGTGFGYISTAGEDATFSGIASAVIGGAILGALNPAAGALRFIQGTALDVTASDGGFDGWHQKMF